MRDGAASDAAAADFLTRSGECLAPLRPATVTRAADSPLRVSQVVLQAADGVREQ